MKSKLLKGACLKAEYGRKVQTDFLMGRMMVASSVITHICFLLE